ncbi:MAG: hypothetical protein ACPGXI_17495 [Mycobacterium sp.]
MFAGLRVGLHRILVNKETGAIDSWADQVTSGSLIWQGRLVDRARLKDLHTWQLEIQGFDSWLRGDLNALNPDRYFPVKPYAELEAGEVGIAVIFQKRQQTVSGGFTGSVTTEYSGMAWDSGYDLTGSTAQDLAIEIDAAIDDAIDGTADNYNSSGASYSTIGAASFDQFSARIQIDNNGNDREGVMIIGVHAKVAATLGWDFVAQGDGSLDPTDPRTLANGGMMGAQWSPLDGTESLRTAGAAQLNFDSYVWAQFSTLTITNSGTDLDNGGATRVYRPAYSSGAISLQPEGQQVIALGLGSERVESQKAQPPAAYLANTPQIDAADVDSMGWLHVRGEVLEGSGAFDTEASRREVDQVALVAWRDAAGSITGTDPGPKVYVVRWEDPRAFGFEDRRITAPLTVGGSTRLEAGFIGRLGGYTLGPDTYPDQAWRVVPRMILSGGTAGSWSGLTPPSAGDNQPAAATGIQYWSGDVEIASLGLNIEGEAVDLNSWRTAAAGLPNGELGAMASCVYAKVGPFPASEVIKGAHVSRGWCMGIKKGSGERPQYRCFSPWRPVTVSDVEHTLTDADLADASGNGDGWIPEWQSRPFPPIDSFTFNTRDTPDDDGTTLETTMRSLDRGRRSRTGQVGYAIEDRGLSNQRLFDGNDGDVWKWENEAQTYWAKDAANFLAGRTATLRATFNHTQGQFLYPGAVVKISNSFVPKLDGSGLGISNALGRVVGSELVLKGPYAGCTRAEILIQEQRAGEGEGGRLWSGVARVNTLNNTSGSSWDVVVHADAWNIGDGVSDSAAFDEPSGSSVGGTVSLVLIQGYDGTTYSNTVEADLVSVNTSTHTLSITVTSGTMLTDAFTLVYMADYDDQTTSNWPRTLLSVTCDEESTDFGTGPTTGWKLD